MARLFVKDTDEILPITVDWENLMNEVGSPSDVISTSTWELPVVSPAELVSISEVKTADSTTILISGGNPGTTYRIKNTIVTTLSSTFERHVYLQVGDTEPGTLDSAIVVEDGSIVAGANSYSTREAASAYHAARDNSAWFNLTSAQMDAALIRASDYLTQKYTARWKGIRINLTQPMDWPRAGVVTQDFRDPTTGPSSIIRDQLSFLFPEDEVPQEVVDSVAILALESITGGLLPGQSRGGDIKRVKAGSAEVEWFQSASSDSRNFPAIESFHAGLLVNFLKRRNNKLPRG